MSSVSWARFRRDFGRWSELARREPVVIASDGCESLALLSADEYCRLTRLDREPLCPREVGQPDIAALGSATAAAGANLLADLVGAGEGDGRFGGADHDRALYGDGSR